jgi:hypothetical protein
MPEPDEDSTARVEADEADKDASPPFNNTSVNTSDALIASGQESLAVRQQSTLILALTAENPSHEEGGEGVSSVEVSGPVTTDTQLQSLSLVVPSVVPTSTETNITKEVVSSADTRVKEMQLIGHESATIKEKYVDRESRREFDGTVDTMDAEHAVSQASLLLEEGTAENATAQPPVSTEAIRRPTPLQEDFDNDIRQNFMNETVQAEITKETTTWRKSQVAMLSLCLILLVAVAISVGLVVAGGDDGVTTALSMTPTFVPTSAPSSYPSVRPTFSAPVLELYNLLVDKSVDGGQALSDLESPQYKAFMWLSRQEGFETTEEKQLLDSYGITTLYFSTDGANWFNSEGWLSDLEVCSWGSSLVLCDELDSVRELVTSSL